MHGRMNVKTTCKSFGRRTSYSLRLTKPKQFREAKFGVFDALQLCAVNFVLRQFHMMSNMSPLFFVDFISYTQGSEQTNISYQIVII